MLKPQTATAALRQWCQRRGVQTGVDEFIDYLDSKDARYLLPIVRKQLQNTQQTHETQQSLRAESARHLSAQQKSSLRSAFDAGDSELREQVDEAQIAGVDVTYDSQQVQGSIASLLAQLQNDLTS